MLLWNSIENSCHLFLHTKISKFVKSTLLIFFFTTLAILYSRLPAFLLYFYIQPQNLPQSCTKGLATGRKYKFAWFSHFCTLDCYVVFYPQWMCLTWESTTESYTLGIVWCRPFSICTEENGHSFLITHCPKFSTFVVGCL